MSDTTYTVLKDFIKTKLDAISKIQEVTDNPKLKNTGYPSAIITPADQDSDYETTTENERIYAFDISLLYEVKQKGLSNALDALYDLVDDVTDAFDKDSTFTGISLPSKYTMIGVEPAFTGWEQIEDKQLIQSIVKIRVRLSFDITT